MSWGKICYQTKEQNYLTIKVVAIVEHNARISFYAGAENKSLVRSRLNRGCSQIVDIFKEWTGEKNKSKKEEFICEEVCYNIFFVDF